MSKFFSLIKTIWFNLRYLPFYQAIKLPIAVHYKTKCVVSGKILLEGECYPCKIRIGFHAVPVVPDDRTLLYVKGRLVFEGTAHIGRGTRIIVFKNGILELGDNFAISSASYINCFKHIKCGNNIQLAWGDLLMDSDTHIIYDENGEIANEDEEIILGDKIWMGCDCKVLKGTVVPDNCVIGANSVVVSSSKLEPNTLIVGSPAKSVKKISGFKI